MKPTVGRIVHYTLSEEDAAQINRRRTDGRSIADRIAVDRWPPGAQAHIGNDAKAGQKFPMIIVAVWSDTCVNGQVFLDGSDCYWALSRNPQDSGVPEQNGRWNWPPRE